MSIHMVPREQLEAIADNIRSGNAKNEITALGACIFAGGFSHGMEHGGLKVCGHFELPDAALGADVSAQRWPVVVAPLDDTYEHQNKKHSQDKTTWKNAVDYLKENDAVPRVVYCNPPCAAYAKQGARGGIADDANMCYTRYCAFDLCLNLAPDVWMWELVPGIYEDTQQGGRDFLDSMAKTAREQGYQVHYFLTSAAHHGGYQNRPRFHFVASKYDLPWDSTYAEDDDEHKGWRTLGECLDRLNQWIAENGEPPNHEKEEKLAGGSLLDIVPFCPPGGYLRDVNDEVMKRHYRPRGREWDGKSRAGVTQIRGRRDRTCPVIVGGQTVIHPEKHRFLTIRENSAVMGFPYDYRFSHGSKGYQEVGKGLCTHNARFLGLTVAKGLAKKAKPLKSVDETIVTDWRSQVSVPSQSSSPEEKAEWWKGVHPDLNVEWAQPRDKRGPGRPAGSRNKRRGRPSGPKTVMMLNEHEELRGTLEKMGFRCIAPEDAELPDLLGAAGRSDCVVIRGGGATEAAADRRKMIVGASLAQGTQVMLWDCDVAWLPDHASLQSTTETNEQKLGPMVAQALGMSAEDVLAKMMQGQDAAALLAKLLGAA